MIKREVERENRQTAKAGTAQNMMLKNFVNTIELKKQMNHQAILNFKKIAKSNSIENDKY